MALKKRKESLRKEKRPEKGGSDGKKVENHLFSPSLR